MAQGDGMPYVLLVAHLLAGHLENKLANVVFDNSDGSRFEELCVLAAGVTEMLERIIIPVDFRITIEHPAESQISYKICLFEFGEEMESSQDVVITFVDTRSSLKDNGVSNVTSQFAGVKISEKAS